MEQIEKNIAVDNASTAEQPIAQTNSRLDKWKIIAISNSIMLIGVIILLTIALSNQSDRIWEIWSDVYDLKRVLEYPDDSFKPKVLDLKITEFQKINDALTISVIRTEPYMDEQKFTFGILNTSSVALENINLKISSENTEKDISISKIVFPGTMVKTSVVLPKSIYEGAVKIRYATSVLRYREI